jgi:hypothetical protein
VRETSISRPGLICRGGSDQGTDAELRQDLVTVAPVQKRIATRIGCRVDRSIGARDVIAELERLFDRHGSPQVLRTDNRREFIAASLGEWLAGQGVKTAFVEKGSPQQNPFVERFNGTMRDELLNGEEFDSLLEARVVIGAWVEEYNTLRPHRGLGMMTLQPVRGQQERGTEVRATPLKQSGPVGRRLLLHTRLRSRGLRGGKVPQSKWTER